MRMTLEYSLLCATGTGMPVYTSNPERRAGAHSPGTTHTLENLSAVLNRQNGPRETMSFRHYKSISMACQNAICEVRPSR